MIKRHLSTRLTYQLADCSSIARPRYLEFMVHITVKGYQGKTRYLLDCVVVFYNRG
jgi:hypothetical protein